ncbi:MAG: NAD-dependent epimerase [Dehalococcoidia bacterium]|nr:NAD-dependent epimerase [Dehalococcoidia bacterium]
MSPMDRHDLAGPRVLVTGGLGFIGSNLARRLVSLGVQVTLVDAMIPDHGGNYFNVDDIRDQLTIAEADIRDQPRMSSLVRDQDVIFNLAGQVGHIDSMNDPFTDLEINCRAQLALVEACRWHNPSVKVVYASTRQVYGRPEYVPSDERHPTRPTDVNGINKLAGERYHILYHEIYGIRATALRLTNTYGPRQALGLGPRQALIPYWLRLAIEDQEIEVWGDGRQLRDLTHVDDVVEAFLLAATSDAADGEVFNVGGQQPISLRDLAELITQVAGTGRVAYSEFPDERKRIDVGSVYLESGKIVRALGWHPQVDLDDGLRRTIAYFREYQDQYW